MAHSIYASVLDLPVLGRRQLDTASILLSGKRRAPSGLRDVLMALDPGRIIAYGTVG